MWTCPKCGEKIKDEFASCWRCAAQADPNSSPQRRRLTLRFCASAALASVLAVVVAECAHSLREVSRGFKYYQGLLDTISTSTYWIALAAQALVTFSVLLLLVKLRVPDWLAWLCCLVFWLLLQSPVKY